MRARGPGSLAFGHAFHSGVALIAGWPSASGKKIPASPFFVGNPSALKAWTFAAGMPSSQPASAPDHLGMVRVRLQGTSLRWPWRCGRASL